MLPKKSKHMNTNSGWWLSSSDQDIRSEFTTEFLLREIRIRIFSGQEEIANQVTRIKKGGKALVFTDSSVTDLKGLDCFPDQSVILFILSDETYSLVFNLRALFNKKISIVVRNYPLGDFRTLTNYPFVICSKILRGLRFPKLWKLFPRALVSSMYMITVQSLLRVGFILWRKEYFHLPLGYDSGFAQLFAQYFKVEDSGSLIEFSLSKNNVKCFQEKQEDFFFIGQRGTFDRQLLLAEAEQLGIKLQKVHESYSFGRLSEYQKIYFEGILSARFSLAPPGNYSAHTFRYCESLLVHSYPIGERWVLSDPLYSGHLSFTWKLCGLKNHKSEKVTKHYDNFQPEIIRQLEKLNQLRLVIVECLTF